MLVLLVIPPTSSQRDRSFAPEGARFEIAEGKEAMLLRFHLDPIRPIRCCSSGWHLVDLEQLLSFRLRWLLLLHHVLPLVVVCSSCG